MKIFLLFLTTIGFLNASGTTAEETTELTKLTKIVSPERLLTPERGYIANEYFSFVYIRPDFAPAMAPVYTEPKTMRTYFGTEETFSEHMVKQMFEQKAKKQEMGEYNWCIINRSALCGLIYVYATETKGVLAPSRLLLSSIRGCKQGRALLETIFNYLPDASWYASSFLSNVASWKSQENAGFIYLTTEYAEEYKESMKFYTRPSNTELEGREKFRFSYSGKVCSFAELMS